MVMESRKFELIVIEHQLTYPKVDIKPLTPPSAYRDTMSPKWRTVADIPDIEPGMLCRWQCQLRLIRLLRAIWHFLHNIISVPGDSPNAHVILRTLLFLKGMAAAIYLIIYPQNTFNLVFYHNITRVSLQHTFTEISSAINCKAPSSGRM